MKKNDSFDNFIAIGALGLGAWLLLSGKGAGSGSEGGSFVAPLIPSLPGETQPQTTIYPITSATKKELSNVQYSSLASYIPILNSPGVQANPISKAMNIPMSGTAVEGNVWGYGNTALYNPKAISTKKESAVAPKPKPGIFITSNWLGKPIR